MNPQWFVKAVLQKEEGADSFDWSKYFCAFVTTRLHSAKTNQSHCKVKVQLMCTQL